MQEMKTFLLQSFRVPGCMFVTRGHVSKLLDGFRVIFLLQLKVSYRWSLVIGRWSFWASIAACNGHDDKGASNDKGRQYKYPGDPLGSAISGVLLK